MKDYQAFLLLIKTNFNKLIATFVHSKFENTEEKAFQMSGIIYDGLKLTKN